MPTVPYSFHLTDLASGAIIAADVEVHLDVKVDVEWGEPVVTVLAVHASDVDASGKGDASADLLTSGDTLAKAIGQRVKALAERDPYVWERALDDDARERRYDTAERRWELARDDAACGWEAA